MSHLTVYSTELTGLSKQLLSQALRDLAKEIGATVTSQIVDYYGDRKTVDVALHMKTLTGYSDNRGIGFNIKNGTLEIVGDNWGFEKEFDRMKDLVTSYVGAHKVAMIARASPVAADGSVLRGVHIRPLKRTVQVMLEYV